MACQNCHKIRAAILHGKMAEAAGLTVDKLREVIGLKSDEPATDADPVPEPDAKGDVAKAKKAA